MPADIRSAVAMLPDFFIADDIEITPVAPALSNARRS